MSSKPNEKIEYIGIDFGSYQTTIATTSGFKKTIPTMVGWAKDFIAVRFMGKEAVIGNEAFDKRLSLNICQPLKSGLLKDTVEDKKAASALIDSILAQARQTGNSSNIHMAIGVTPKANDTDKKAFIDLVSEKVDMVTVVSQPFAIAYNLDMLSNSLIIDIGAETIDLCLLYGTFPEEKDQITIDAGLSSIDKLLISGLKRTHENSFMTENIAKRIRESHGFVGEPSERITYPIPISEKLEDVDITSELKDACESIIPQIMEAVRYFLAMLDSDYQRETRKNIIIAGAGGQIKGLAEYIESHLQKESGPTKVTAIENPTTTSADGVLKLAMELPIEYWTETKAAVTTNTEATTTSEVQELSAVS